MIPPTIPELIAHAAAHPFLREHLSIDADSRGGRAHALFDETRIESGYQPIFDVSMNGMQTLWSAPESADRFGDELGFQALTLQPDGNPLDLFERVSDGQALVALDRLARTLHAVNFFGAQQHGLLFLRVHERLLKSVKYDHGQHFSSVLISLGLNPGRVVIELPSAAVAHRTFLGYLAKSYQRFGFKVAGNLPNAGHIMSVSDMARLDFLKIDGAAVLRDSMVKPLLAYANRLHIPLIFDRVATEAQFDALQQFGARFVQGPLFEPHAPVR
ncbi:EAL domain-containing protein [Trinickia caryophylli]|uniref:EAL domain, c-di-GMP-specific phosphodiesterase class I (Or its enzymatically inactive variant) n=1 Tax=Trinickia caryophylli TaxID=28094 RepID=A0A1X7CF73_TRICW|nr:EAL domain-containing protein [Trinickia caryophylli]PMS11621.1 diguanylate phosphodiesterase [Trinickia caryophylli]TRX19820.1 EAL domain-containing protein [Trinickia caryophylli]WQE12851.1 EAL domain-containing protein [Trinickia caryophylli]SME95536.1 EAL domain, c-di-GMP-specific phosphodiesterase class I (or its enzymatically inactive variant) [Trinickia caryophylli]GLU30572.1 EAL domain-containing protein [Trinickia caryophylli]